MELREAFKISWSNMRSHKLRSFLALLGVMIGVGAVIAIVTMTSGLERAVLDTFTKELLRADMISVTTEGGFAFFGQVQAFSARDVEHIKQMPHVKAADTFGRVRGDTLKFNGKRMLDVVVRVMTDPEIIPLDVGRPLQARGEIVIGVEIAKTICERLLTEEQAAQSSGLTPEQEKEKTEQIKKTCEHPGRDPALANKILNQTLELKYLSPDKTVQQDQLRVVGILKDSQFFRQDVAYVTPDYHSDVETIDGQEIPVFTGIIVKVENINKLGEVEKALEAYFKSDEADARKILGQEKKVEINTLEEIVGDIKKEIGRFMIFMGAIAAVALLVGMIGVMNVMLISVKERTREIGVMKATGATNGGILRLFLTEAVLICSSGATMGIVLGMLGALGVIRAMAAVFELKGVPFVLVPEWYMIAVLTGMIVGMVSGVYPAWQAARVNPIEALRYE